jgi:predicted metal-dependent hydrolase
VSLGEEEREALRRGVREFNAGYYFECHDTLEEAWSGLRGEPRDFFQGLIQVAVALYHWRNGNHGGALSMLKRARGRLARYPPTFCGFDLAALRPEVEAALERVEAREPFPEGPGRLPRYVLESESGAP